MNNKLFIEQIKKAAQKDSIKRKDIRYKRAMGFLVKKGFLKANEDFGKYYQAKVFAKDLIWAGKNVEPRILEVLPVAVLRLPKAFIIGTTPDEIQLKEVARDLQSKKEDRDHFLKMPYQKIKVWMNFPLKDKRTKISSDKKIMKSFRLKPEILHKLKQLKLKNNMSESEVIEDLIARI